MAVKIVTDSTSYIPMALRNMLDIHVVSLSVNFEHETYREEAIDNSTFYSKMAQSKKTPTSSQPTLQDFYQVFEELIKANHSVVGIFISSDMSGTYNGALAAKKMILEKYPQATIEIVDSRSNCMEAGFAVLAAAQAAQEGHNIDGVLNNCYRTIERTRFLFIPHTLEYLRKGGRIGGAQALLGTILQLKPILTVIDGKTAVFDKVRTKSRAIDRLLQEFYQDVERKGLEKVAIHHIDNEKEGQEIALAIGQKLHTDVPLYPIGPVIGLHVGPGTIGLVYQTREAIVGNS